MKPTAWYDPSNGMVSTDKDSPLFTPLGQVLPLHPQSGQEPVAWMVYTQEGQYAFVTDDPAIIHPSQRALPLYATPQRKWVGLTDEEITELRLKTLDVVATNYEVYQAIEAKLKEKNT